MTSQQHDSRICENSKPCIDCEYPLKNIGTQVQDIIEILDNTDNDDENIEALEKAMEFFCGNYDICEGFKHAIRMTIEDQFNNHQDEIDTADLVKLRNILLAKSDMRPTYSILFSREEGGRVAIHADSEEEARELFESGEYDSDEERIKNGQTEIIEVSRVG